MENGGLIRCGWGDWTDPAYLAYHDLEWGTPSRDRRHLFEMLVLEGAQAGLSWSTILRKRDGYRAAFAGFVPERVATFGPDDVDRLLLDAGIVRNRAKIESAIDNARALLSLEAIGLSFVDYVWSFVGGHALQNTFAGGEIPAETTESQAMSRDLKKRGFRFMGPTTCYAFMQATGLVNDHAPDCFRYAQVAALA
ncbi:MAG: DNA-3-methyladenine glycosylase I [Chloroflexi bacterium]|nr:DNA-3-methyladenine glycosylase I [Chloroflexota bacterium]